MSFRIRDPLIGRRNFVLAAGASAAATAFNAPLRGGDASEQTDRVPLGLDGHSLRGMKWKATQLIEFAAQHRLDAVLLNNLNYFESLEETHLQTLKRLAERHEIQIYVGAGCICRNAARFSDKWGTAEELVATGIRVAATLGSPVVNVKIGSIEDRFLDGGIEPRIDEAVRVLRASCQRAKDAGVRFGFENHAADLRSEELLAAIEAVGTDVCGVMLDPGNSLWAMEDPMVHLQKLAPHVVCNSLRDYMVWETPEGASFQWTALGDGLMDVPAYVATLAESCPGMPVFVESISNSVRSIPFLTEQHWKAYPNLKGDGIVDFLKLCRRGREMKTERPPSDADRREFDRQHQKREFFRSVEYLRRNCPVGLKVKS